MIHTLRKNRTVNVEEIGGTYTRKFYCRQIIAPSTSHVNVPVTYQYA